MSEQRSSRQKSTKAGSAQLSGLARPFSVALAILTLLALIGALILTLLLNKTLPMLERFAVIADGKSAAINGWSIPPPAGRTGTEAFVGRGMLILLDDINSPRTSDRLLAASLADVGFGITVIPSLQETTGEAPISRIVTRIMDDTGLRTDQIVIAGRGTGADKLIAALPPEQSPLYPKDLILISPADEKHLLVTQLAALPINLKVTIISAAQPQASLAARDFFLAASGEDATLFPGLRSAQPLSPETILSINGLKRLVILPYLSVINEGWSPRLHQVLQQAVINVPKTAASVPGSIRTLYNRLLLPVWILLMLAAVPLLLTLTRTAQAKTASQTAMTADTSDFETGTRIDEQSVTSARTLLDRSGRRSPWFELLLYLPAAVAAIPLGHLMAGLAGDARLTGGYTLYAMIGIYGWLYFFWHLLFQPEPVVYRPAVERFGTMTARTVLFALVYLTAVLFWMTTMFGPILPQGRARLMLLPIWVLLLPAMLPACISYRRSIARQRISYTLLHLLPSAVLLLILSVPNGISALPGAAFILLLLIAGRITAKALSCDPSLQLIPSAAGSLLILLLCPMPVF